MLPCVILGGGLGTRLGDLTRSAPKPLVEVAGEPFVQHQLRWLVAEGVTEVVYSVGHLGDLIREELAQRPPAGCTVRFVDDGPRPMGTGGAVRLAVDQGAVGEAFLVLYGDSYLRIDVAAVVAAFEGSGADALMTVLARPGAPDNNATFVDGRVVRYDKSEPDPVGAGMGHVDYGLSALRADSVRELVPAGETADLADAFRSLAASGRLAGFEAEHPFHEVGSPAGLAALDRHLQGSAP